MTTRRALEAELAEAVALARWKEKRYERERAIHPAVAFARLRVARLRKQIERTTS